MAITRANPYLEEIIEILDHHRSKYTSDDEARAYLTAADNAWLDDEFYKCITEPRYFLSNYYAIRTEDQGFQGLYPFFDSQEILHDELRKLEKTQGKVRAMVLKARRMGYTTYMIGEFLHKTAIKLEHTDAIIVSQDEKGAKYNMGMYESAFDFLPWWMKPRVNIHQTGAVYNFDEQDEILRATRPGLKNWVYADNANRPSGVGRGQGFRCGMLDELAFWNNASQLSKSLLRSFQASDGFYVMGSTANGRNDAWHNLWRRAEQGSIDWNPIFIPFYRRPKTYSLPIAKTTVFVLTPEETEMRKQVFEKESYLITNETFNWMRKTKEEFTATDGDDMLFSQEYTSNAEESFQNSALTAIPRGIINKFSKRTANPKWIGEIRYEFEKKRPHLIMRDVGPEEDLPYPEFDDRLSVWEKPMRGSSYCVGVDVSLGNPGGDYSCCQVLKISKTQDPDVQVACWHGLINPEDLAEIVLALCTYYEYAMAAVEVNAMGMSTNSILMRMHEYDNIYRFKRMDRMKHFITDIVGWLTDYKSKRALISKMDKVMRCNAIEIPDAKTIDEFRDFTEDGADGEGAHDDYVMALMIAEYCAHEGEFQDNLSSQAKKEPEDANEFQILDRNGVVQFVCKSQGEAEFKAKKIIHSQIVRKAGAKADLVVNGKKFRIPSDFQNTDHSIFDKDGVARQMQEDGIPSEQITPELMAEYEANQEDTEESETSWMAE